MFVANAYSFKTFANIIPNGLEALYSKLMKSMLNEINCEWEEIAVASSNSLEVAISIIHIIYSGFNILFRPLKKNVSVSSPCPSKL